MTTPVHRHDPVLRWYRAVCGDTLPDEPIQHDAARTTCPKCLAWQAEEPWRSLSAEEVRVRRREAAERFWAAERARKAGKP